MMGITMEAIEEMYVTLRPKSLGIADLGCSSGSNAMSYVKRIVGAVQNTAKKFEQPAPNEIRVCLNDLPTNDFNTIFQALPDLYEELNKTIRSNIFIGAFPGSFFGRLFPENSLHFVYSFNCLHWLSRVCMLSSSLW
ncbi:PREDICTED: jasmonate O-methyltransferase-like [Erythranthe guttata]|uniref:jasmonate O-methyltransferase-like n=1 Tax=Erythranthe guttata TaxID=4155 RepID=UPI00064DC180|nr:PREDICTED: jasmonate O-methyltransferase-like [Erythranthe guttata]|eukprot:XP_012853184.1 PREDICTED: jasmonate O-methyltransferase-like [Erythranthe guttata]